MPKGMAAGGSGKQELEGLMPSAVPAHPHCCSFPLLPLGSRSSSLPVPHGSTLVWGQPFPLPGTWVFPRKPPAPLEVGEAAGILLVVVGNAEDGVVELVVAELLEGHSGRDGGEHRDV